MNTLENTRESTRKNTLVAPVKSDWVQSVSERAGNLENEIGTFLRERPLVALGGALGIGLASYFLIKRKSESLGVRSRHSRSKNNGKSSAKTGAIKAANAGLLAQGLSPMISRFQDEFDRSGFEGFPEAKDKVTAILSEELIERPLPTIGAVIALGYGLGGLEFDEMKRGFLKFAQRIAVKSFDAGIDASKPKKSASPSNTNLEGENHEYDEKQRH